MDMKPRHAAACARCGNPGEPYQLNDLLRFDQSEPVVALCNDCLYALRYADATTWKWVREYRESITALALKSPVS